MDITVISQLVTQVGVPIACTIIFLWIVIDVYKFSKTRVAEHLTKQTDILDKQTDTVESISRAIETFASVLDRICATTTHIEIMAVSALAKRTGGKLDEADPETPAAP
jgi:hypothetical protein